MFVFYKVEMFWSLSKYVFLSVETCITLRMGEVLYVIYW
jgi:hypothetical protein